MSWVFSRPAMPCQVTAAIFGITLSLAAGMVAASPPADVPGKATGRPDFPELNFPDRSNGEVAIGRLGAKLPDVAASYDMSPAQFTRMLREDGTAWIDMKGRLLFIDIHEDQSGASEAPELLDAAPFPPENTFKLHSRPGANRIIYLDFDGHVTSGTRWNTESGIDPIISPPYTRDGDSTFSDLELEYIQKMWRQVSEDYAPFDVDVTTEDPGEAALLRSSSGDSDYGIRVVVTEDNFDNCGCGGFAYVGVFDSYGSTNYKPAFVFNNSLVGAGEASSHEAGHTLGLRHDGITGGATYYSGHGSGATGWAPIMGSGYSRLLVQWSRGEYSGANNQEDDIAIIRNNGAPYRVDDHGDSSGSASALSFTSDGSIASLSGSGLISLADDQDVFSFIAGAGAYSIDVNPAAFSPNLDIRAQLKNGAGVLVNESNPTDALSASMSGTLTAGEYFLHIDGVGKGDASTSGYSDYSSLGHYAISASVADAAGLAPPTAVAKTTYAPDFSGTLVEFDGSDSSAGEAEGSISGYEWDFGDGASGTGPAPTHQYSAPGSYQVILTVSDDNLPPLTDNDSLSIVVLNRDPVAVAGADTPTGGTAPLAVQFNGTGSYDPDTSGNIASYNWNFGDGNSSSLASPTHEYSNWGELTATLTVTDNLGASAQDQVALSIDPPPFIDQSSSSEQAIAGTVGGNHTQTHASDGLEQSIRERESGGKKRSRHSYLEHRWNFNVSAGNSTRLDIQARQDSSSDGDGVLFAYSVNGADYQPVDFSSSNSGVQSFNLAGNPSGQITVRVMDSDRSSGNRSLDTFYIDYLNIHTTNDGGVAPTAPVAASWSSSNPIVVDSSSQISLSWDDNSADENGFRVQRSEDEFSGGAVTNIPLGMNQTSYTDSGLSPGTKYFYQVFAYNAVGDAASSGIVSATTDEDIGPPVTVDLSVRTFKRKGVKHVELSWTGLDDGTATIRFNGNELVTGESSPYEHNLNSKGGGSYTYQICHDSGDPCSAIENAVF